jgi:cytochrome c oxidase cbb3-type subunit 4
MDMYSLMRQFADSWALVVLVLVFVGIIGWAWRPNSRKIHDETAAIPFRHDDKPLPASPSKEQDK